MFIKEIDLVNRLIKKNPNRADLVSYRSSAQKKFCVKVYRNHSFEFVSSIIHPYLDLSDIDINFEMSDYDDSLSFADLDEDELKTLDAIILWIDLDRYNHISLNSFLEDRLNYLRSITSKPILAVFCGKVIRLKVSDILILNVNELLNSPNDHIIYDDSLISFTGTRLTRNNSSKIAKILGLKYLPYLFNFCFKAVITDLDNTLYDGVLGEDGLNDIKISESYLKLQNYLKELSDNGFFLCVVSKNVEADVINLLSSNRLNLNKSDFTFIKASWDAKSFNIEEIIKNLNISPENVLFLDDNIGELIEVKSRIPNIHVLQADKEPNITLNVLENYPGLTKFGNNIEDKIRSKDVIANQKRKIMQKALSNDEYLKSLNMRLKIYINDLSGAERIAQLGKKTNQFIFSYKRYNLNEIVNLLNQNNYLILSFHLSDVLSDSGMIGAAIFKHDHNTVLLDELFISCRALGRNVENLIILKGLFFALDYFNEKILRFSFIKGERNIPAESFYYNNLIKFDYTKSRKQIENQKILNIEVINGN